MTSDEDKLQEKIEEKEEVEDDCAKLKLDLDVVIKGNEELD